MLRPAAKLSVSVPGDLAAKLRKAVGARGLSAFVTRAMQHELERQQLGTLLQELEAELGPACPDNLSDARAKFAEVAGSIPRSIAS